MRTPCWSGWSGKRTFSRPPPPPGTTERTLAACRRVLDHARANPALLDRLAQTGRLPIGELAAGSGVDKKTIERHRKYLVAVLLAFTNGYEIIRGHLCQMVALKEGVRE